MMRIADLFILPPMDCIKKFIKNWPLSTGCQFGRQANILILNKCNFFLDFMWIKGILVSVKLATLFSRLRGINMYSDGSCFFSVPLERHYCLCQLSGGTDNFLSKICQRYNRFWAVLRPFKGKNLPLKVRVKAVCHTGCKYFCRPFL